MRVLIADDSELLVERLTANLAKMSGIEVIGRAGNALEASNAIRELKPDAVVLDLCMPGGSGMDVLRRVKVDGSAPVIIVLTGYTQSQYRKRCLEGGASFFFDKSTEFGKVAEALQGLMGRPSTQGEDRELPGAKRSGSREGATIAPAGAARPGPAAAPGEKPKLLVSALSKGEPIYFICSQCLHGFPLSTGEVPKKAMQALYQSFREHVAGQHPEGSDAGLPESPA